MTMTTFADMNQEQFRDGFRAAVDGKTIPLSETPQYFGYAFGIRIIKSIRPEWDPGDAVDWDMAQIRQTLSQVAVGGSTILPSPAELASELDGAWKEIWGDVPMPNFHQALRNNIAAAAATGRKAKDDFDRDAAAHILSSGL
jgi:hypothetical protein